MKYKNASDVLPEELVKAIQEYIQGEVIYIPKADRKAYRNDTEYKVELSKRNTRIFRMHLEGMSNFQLARNFSLAESSIRRILIKEKKRFDIVSDKIKTLLPCWGLENLPIKQIYGTVWQIGEDYVLKYYTDPVALKRNITINSHLEDMQIPVGKVIYTVDKRQYVEDNGEYFVLCLRLKGSNILSLKFGNRIAESMGRIIAKLHLAFESLEEKVEVWDNSLSREMKGWVRESFELSGWQNISEDDYCRVSKNLENHYEKLPAGLIHRDVHFGNFLFDKGVFSGYIDFDLSQKNIRIFDLCYFSLSVLSEKEKFELSEEKWFDFIRNVFAGYNQIIELTWEEKESAVYVMECIELLFLAYFEGQDDTALAQKTFNVFRFISENQRRITKSIS